jgi:outer membrane lipoprotein-sorting protein
MAEFKFSCPQCSQHIQCDTGYAGVQINCPTCQQAIVVPQAPGSAVAPPPHPIRSSLTPSGLTTSRSTMAPSGERHFSGAAAAQPVQAKSHTLRNVLVITAVVAVFAALGFGGWHIYSKHKAKLGNPATQVATPTAAATIQALSILSKVHLAYTNLTSVTEDSTVALFLNVSNITLADVSPNLPANAKNANRHPPGMPRMITNTTELSIKRAQPDLYYVTGEAVSKIDRLTMTNTFAFWKSDKGQFMFTDSHQKMLPPSYRQLAASNSTNSQLEQFKNIQHLFDDPANLTKIIKDLGQTEDESVNGQDCYTLTAKVLGQKVKIWVGKASYLIPQWQITLGGTISDTDIDDAFALFSASATNAPPAQLDMIKAQVKKMTPTMTKIRGTITSTSRNIEINPALSADDFNYPVPQDVRLVRMPAAATTAASSAEVRQRNACINNLRQLDAAKNQWALEQRKKNGDMVTEADITPYIKLDASGNLPKCPAGGKYTIGRVGTTPTCSIPGHLLP